MKNIDEAYFDFNVERIKCYVWFIVNWQINLQHDYIPVMIYTKWNEFLQLKQEEKYSQLQRSETVAVVGKALKKKNSGTY